MAWWPWRWRGFGETEGDRPVSAVVQTTLPERQGLAAIAACVTAYGSAAAGAAVVPARLSGALSPSVLRALVLELLLTGESTHRIDVTPAGRLALRPAVLSHVSARGPDPDTWAYRLTVPYPYGVEHSVYPAARVVALRLHPAPDTPWRGRSPLALSPATAGLAALCERQLAGEMSVITGRVLGLPSGTREIPGADKAESEIGDVLRRSDGVLALFDYDESGSVNPDVKPDRWQPSRVGAEPARATVELRRDMRIDVCGVFGIPAALLFPDAGQAGTGVIEMRRSWLRSAVAPLLADVAAQMAGPLDAPDLAFRLPALEADTADASSRAVMRRAQAYRALVDAQMKPEMALWLSGLPDA